ncbi:MAG TPA: hypothetical protein VGD31_15150 [Sphingobacteriaceae bacterium]
MKVREHYTGRKIKKMASDLGRINRYWLSTMDRRGKLGTTTHIYYYGRGTWRYRNYITYQEFTHRLAIIFTSAAVFGTGLGQLIYQFFGK